MLEKSERPPHARPSSFFVTFTPSAVNFLLLRRLSPRVARTARLYPNFPTLRDGDASKFRQAFPVRAFPVLHRAFTTEKIISGIVLCISYCRKLLCYALPLRENVF